MIVLDTSVLIAAFRHRSRTEMPAEVTLMRRLIEVDAPMAVPGVVLQELLAGAATEPQFERLAGLVQGFPLLLADRDLHHRAARIATTCRWAGVMTTSADCLIAAHTIASDGSLFTLDREFGHMAACCGLRIFAWR